MKSTAKSSTSDGLGLVHAMFAAGDVAGAFRQLLSLRKKSPRNTQVQKVLANMAARAGNDIPDSPKLTRELVRCLDDRQGDAREIMCAAGVILGRDSRFSGMLSLLASGRMDSNRDALLAGDFAPLFKNPLFSALLTTSCLTNVKYEMAMTALRRLLLDSVSAATPSLEVVTQVGLDFCAALAQQCWLNEYVYGLEAGEGEAAGRLRGELLKSIDVSKRGDRWLAARLAVFLMYHPFDALSVDPADWSRWETQWPSPLHWVLKVRAEAEVERRLKTTIRSTAEPKDLTSREVQAQYESHPYPRWFGLSLTWRTSVGKHLSEQFPHFRPPEFLFQPVRLLNAGCGTGREVLSVHATWQTAEITAVDLSMSSLAYAARMAQVHGVDDEIEFVQADILELPALFRDTEPFDVICSSGVLHHMEDPLQGWRALMQVLRPGGVMRIGLYSATARRQVLRAREMIGEQGLDASPDGIRRFRQAVFKSADPELSALARFSDLFNMSGCRDLLFHVREWDYTLPDIRRFLDELGLELIGFEGIEGAKAAYARAFPDDASMTNLDHWTIWERRHPDTFAAMYNMVVRKPL